MKVGNVSQHQEAMSPEMKTLPIIIKHFYPARLASGDRSPFLSSSPPPGNVGKNDLTHFVNHVLMHSHTDDSCVSLWLGCPAEVVKHIYMEGADRVYLERGPDGKPAAARKRHHKSDGLIFAPNR